jgi:hypothetical protein
MKVAVIGSRTINNSQFIYKKLDEYDNENPIDILISGHAEGVDKTSEKWAKLRGIETLIFPPEYEKYGNKAPLKRNHDIINNCDICIAFWNGKSTGTKYTIDLARKQNKEVIIYKC